MVKEHDIAEVADIVSPCDCCDHDCGGRIHWISCGDNSRPSHARVEQALRHADAEYDEGNPRVLLKMTHADMVVLAYEVKHLRGLELTRSVQFSGEIVYETAQLPLWSRLRWAWALLWGQQLRLITRELEIVISDD